MTIDRLDIVSFGKFKNKTIELNTGLNIISGANESGKSTVAAFIYAMLYGFGDNRGKSISFRERYRPWDGGECEGSLTLTLENGKKYTIYRKAGATKKYDVTSVYDALTGAKVDILPESLADTDAETFSKTLFIKQNGSVFSGATKELSTRLSNLASGGDEEYNIKKALETLHNMKREISSSRGSGELSDIYKQIESLNLKEEKLRSIQNEIAFTESELNRAEKEAQKYFSICTDLSSQIENFGYDKLIKHIEETEEPKTNSTESPSLKFPLVTLALFSLFFFVLSISVHALFLVLSVLPLSLFLWLSAKKKGASSKEAQELNKLKNNALEMKNQLEKLNGEYKFNQEKHTEAKAYAAQLSQKLEYLKSTDFDEHKFMLKKLNERKKELEVFVNALMLAQNALEKTYDGLVCGFIPDLNKKASEYFKEITDEKYTSLLSDADFDLSVELTEPKESTLFSGGTIDQMYLSLRLALIDILFQSSPVCMIIDQPFMQYDSLRKKRAAQILTKLSEKRQILLFTGQDNNISELKSTEILT